MGSLKIIVEVSRNGKRHTVNGTQLATISRGQGVLLLIFFENYFSTIIFKEPLFVNYDIANIQGQAGEKRSLKLSSEI